MPRLFGTAGIRARYFEKVNPQLAFNLGLALAKYNDSSGKLVLGHDVRTTSPLLAYALASGAMSGGLDVLILGLAPTPVVAYSTYKTDAKVGVSVTASHNPPEDNGFKVYDSNGMEYTVDMEEEIEELLENIGEDYYVPWNRVGKPVSIQNLIEEYIDELIDKFKTKPKRSVKVIVDCANGAAYDITPRILRSLGAKTLTIHCNPDGFFPGRTPEPRPDVLHYLNDLLCSLDAEIAFAHDGDADRLSVLTRKQGFIKQDRLIALYAKLKLSDRKGSIIVSIDVGRAVEEIVERYGGRIIRWKLGKTHEKLKEKTNVLLAAEPWKLIDPDWGLWVDGIYQATWLTNLILTHGSLDDLLKDIPDYPSKRISIKFDEEKIADVYKGVVEDLLSVKGNVKITTIDGVRLDYDDYSWVLVRKSGTEPKIRVYVEARNSQRLKELTNHVLELVKKHADKRGAKIYGIEGM